MNLRTKLLIFSMIVALIPLGISGIILIRITRDELKSSANENLLTAATQLALDIEDYYKYTWLAPLNIIQKSLDNEGLGVNEKLAILTESMQSIKDFVIFQISVEGVSSPLKIIQDEFAQKLLNASLDPEKLLHLSSQEILAYKMGNSSFSSYIRYIEAVDTWLLTVIYPLDHRTFGSHAFLSVRIDLKRLQQRIDTHPFHQNGYIALVNATGQRLFDVNQTDLSTHQIVQTAIEILSGSSRSVGVVPYTRPSGQKMLGAYAFPSGLDMAVIVEQNEKDAYLAVKRMEWTLVAWSVFGVLIAGIGAIVVSVSLTRPLHRLTKAARQIAQGDLSVNFEGHPHQDEIGELSSAFIRMIDDLRHYIERLTETTKAKERVESELNLAKEIQQSFLPKEFPESEAFDVWGRCDSAREVGGDYYDFFRIDSHRFGVAIGDVSGKGMPAALFMAVSRTLFRVLSSQPETPDKVLTEFNNRLVSLDQGANMFITLFYGIFDQHTGKLMYSSAGHHMPHIIRNGTHSAEVMTLPRMKTMVAGILDGLTMELGEVNLLKGDMIVFYTDGMTEAINLSEEEFGEERFINVITQYSQLSAREACENVIQHVQTYQTGMPQFDDMTLLILKVNNGRI